MIRAQPPSSPTGSGGHMLPLKKRKLVLLAKNDQAKDAVGGGEGEAASGNSNNNAPPNGGIPSDNNNNNNVGGGSNQQPPQENDAPMEIDEGLYNRQLYVLGRDAMARMAESNVLICGLGGLGVEIAKNVILGGIKSVTLMDTKVTHWKDLSSQFYLTEKDLGLNRAVQSRGKLSELNPYVSVNLSTEPLTTDYLSRNQFQVVVLSEGSETTGGKIGMEEVLDYCHEHGICVILAESRGLFARVFCDFGEEFTVVDATGAEPKTAMVTSVSKEEEALVTCHDENRHELVEGDYVRFDEVEGMVELNGLEEPVRVTQVPGPYSFRIELNTTEFGDYKRGGIVTQVKVPETLHFKSYRNSLAEPDIVLTDFGKIERAGALHLAFQALDDFILRNSGRLPTAWNEQDADLMVELAQAIAPQNGDMTVEESVTRLLSYVAEGQVCPMNGFVGGIVAQEVMKACSGKFRPIVQWLYYDAVECLSEEGLENLDEKGRFKEAIDGQQYRPRGSRYDGQISVFGREFQNTLGSLKYFLVGAGAIGCELLKNLGMLGVSTGREGGGGVLHITDMDRIERSNLNRQFLFRPRDVGQPKSRTAADAVRDMNPEMNIHPHELRVGPETENIFSDAFFEDLDGVANALDNVRGRLYMDGRCVYYRKSLLESGTLGTMGNTQVIIPHLTQSYGSSQDPPEDKQIPLCTLKSFPNAIEHTLQWARELFEELFTQEGAMLLQYLRDPAYAERRLRELPNPEANELLEDFIRIFITEKRQRNFEECVLWARLTWEWHFNNSIQQLLIQLPPDRMNEDGTPFWSGPKRCPAPLSWTAGEEEGRLAHDFVFAAANLRAEVYGIAQNRNRAVVNEMADLLQVPEFIPRPAPPVDVGGNPVPVDVGGDLAPDDDDAGGNLAPEDDDEVDRALELMGNIRRLWENGQYSIHPIQFEKDDDSNLHIDFIVSASNARGQNYRIPPADRLKCKQIAGKIIPAIATTTSVVAGLQSLELIKLAQQQNKDHRQIEKFRNGFLNLASPLFAFSEPEAAKKEFNRGEWTLWDRFDVNGQREDDGSEMTLGQFMAHFREGHGLDINMLSYGPALLYSFFMPEERREQRLNMPMTEVIRQVTGSPVEPHVRNLVFEINCEDEHGEDVEITYVRFRLPEQRPAPDLEEE